MQASESGALQALSGQNARVRLPYAANMAESTKELTDEGAKVTTTVEGSDATAAAPAESGKKGYWPGAVWNSTGRVDGVEDARMLHESAVDLISA